MDAVAGNESEASARSSFRPGSSQANARGTARAKARVMEHHGLEFSGLLAALRFS
jgi:hypothetical protein